MRLVFGAAGFYDAARALSHGLGHPPVGDAPGVDGMERRQVDDVVGAVLEGLGVQRAAGEDVVVHLGLHRPLGFGPATLLVERQPQLPLDAFVKTVEEGLAAKARSVLQELDFYDARKADPVVRPEGIGVVSHVPEALGSVRILEDGLKRPSAGVGRGESGVAKGLDVDDLCRPLGVDEDRHEGEGPVATTIFSLEVQI